MKPSLSFLRRGLPTEPIARRRVYKARYDRWWRRHHPGYHRAYYLVYKTL